MLLLIHNQTALLNSWISQHFYIDEVILETSCIFSVNLGIWQFSEPSRMGRSLWCFLKECRTHMLPCGVQVQVTLVIQCHDSFMPVWSASKINITLLRILLVCVLFFISYYGNHIFTIQVLKGSTEKIQNTGFRKLLWISIFHEDVSWWQEYCWQISLPAKLYFLQPVLYWSIM